MLEVYCPRCNQESRVEQCDKNVFLSQDIMDITGDEELSYGDWEVFDGVIDRFQCRNCGYAICDSYGNQIETIEDFIEYVNKSKTQGKEQ